PFSASSVSHPALHSFPTRRSSDLGRSGRGWGLCSHRIHATVPVEPVLHQSNLRPVALDFDLREVVFVHQPYERANVVNADSALPDRKSTRLNSSHVSISYAVFCLK